MITRNRIVLVVPNTDIMKDIKYEAVQLIRNVSDVENVWRCNKTPAILEENAEEVRKVYPCLTLPSFIFGHEHFINFCHENGIECGEYRSGTKHNTAEDRCFLCAVGKHLDANGNPFPSLAEFNQFTPEVNDVVIYESENFYVKIEYGCLKKGMVMICPKDHILSAARIPNNQMAEYMQVIRDIQERLPNATIVVSSILPARDPAFQRSRKWRNIPEWSAALEQACRENGIIFANCDDLAEDYPNLWDPDGIHFRKEFYPYWASNLVVATLMEGSGNED